MCPLRLIPKIFVFDDEELLPELRAQRNLNRSRIPEMAEYITRNTGDYVFSSITASINGDVEFAPFSDKGEAHKVGTLSIDMDSQFVINDGQHRRAAIESALKREPRLGDETISVVFFIDRGLLRCQQMFADLNRHVVRPSKSLGLLYDQRDAMAQLTKLVAFKSEAFEGLVEMERTSLSPRSRKLFTLSAIYSANIALLQDVDLNEKEIYKGAEICINYWDELYKHITEWQQVKNSQLTSGEIRKDFIHSHAMGLQALGIVGNSLLQIKSKTTQRQKFQLLKKINWRRTNSRTWEGRAMVGGRMSKNSQNIVLTANYIKKYLKLKLTDEERRVERAYSRGEYGNN